MKSLLWNENGAVRSRGCESCRTPLICLSRMMCSTNIQKCKSFVNSANGVTVMSGYLLSSTVTWYVPFISLLRTKLTARADCRLQKSN